MVNKPTSFSDSRSALGGNPLAELLDRRGCLAAIEEFASAARGEAPQVGVFWLNIDRFKQVNDSFGHLAGDSLLIEVVRRIRRISPGPARIARMSGDEFALVVANCAHSVAERIAQDMLQIVRQPIAFANLRIRPSVSLGIALYTGAESAQDILLRADRAMVEAKRRGGGQHVFDEGPSHVHPVMHLAREELEVEESLHRALEVGGLSLHYQPILRMADGGLEAVEALMRCTVDGNSISPARFIPVAEKTGLIVRIGEWSLLTAASLVSRFNHAGHDIAKVAVNVSRAQLTAPKFTQALYAALACSNIDAKSIELEITESLFMEQSELVQRNIRTAIDAGFSLSIDDFGTGYSCLAVLKDLPADKLKLDRAFVSDLPHDKRTLSISRAITHMALDLGMTIVAEGVETKEQYETLAELGVTAIQGFYLSRPLPEYDLEAWLTARQQP